jgi:carboxypeptidase Taq
MLQAASQRYEEVCRYARQTAVLASIEAVLDWDERTMLPPAGTEHRAQQESLLAGMIHDRWTNAEFGQWLAELVEDPLSADPAGEAGVNLRRLKREYDKKVKLPKSLVEELAQTAVFSQQAWVEARRKSDFRPFRPWLEKMLGLKRQEAEALGYAQCPYDALLDRYEPDARTAEVAVVLAGLRQQLIPLVQEIGQSGRQPDVSLLRRSFPLDAQQAFGRMAAARIGFDFDRGRLDVTAHPFCSGLGPSDCRITTRYDEYSFNEALFGILHEAGHGIYEQGLRADQYGLPLGEAVSLGIHESQSRLWENFVGRSLAFWQFFYPEARRHFTALSDVGLDEFYFAVNDVRPSLIRTEADEATYNLHILIRFELEQALLDGDLPLDDLPAAWNAKYQEYLGITPSLLRTSQGPASAPGPKRSQQVAKSCIRCSPIQRV